MPSETLSTVAVRTELIDDRRTSVDSSSEVDLSGSCFKLVSEGIDSLQHESKVIGYNSLPDDISALIIAFANVLSFARDLTDSHNVFQTCTDAKDASELTSSDVPPLVSEIGATLGINSVANVRDDYSIANADWMLDPEWSNWHMAEFAVSREDLGLCETESLTDPHVIPLNELDFSDSNLSEVSSENDIKEDWASAQSYRSVDTAIIEKESQLKCVSEVVDISQSEGSIHPSMACELDLPDQRPLVDANDLASASENGKKNRRRSRFNWLRRLFCFTA
jgi:hypothetical protein